MNILVHGVERQRGGSHFARGKGDGDPNHTTAQKLWYSVYYIPFTTAWIHGEASCYQIGITIVIQNVKSLDPSLEPTPGFKNNELQSQLQKVQTFKKKSRLTQAHYNEQRIKLMQKMRSQGFPILIQYVYSTCQPTSD